MALGDAAENSGQAPRQALRLLERSVAAAVVGELRVFAPQAGRFRAIDAAMQCGLEATLIALAVGEGRVLEKSEELPQAILREACRAGWADDSAVMMLRVSQRAEGYSGAPRDLRRSSPFRKPVRRRQPNSHSFR